MLDKIKDGYGNIKNLLKKSIQGKVDIILESLIKTNINETIDKFLKQLNEVIQDLSDWKTLSSEIEQLKIKKVKTESLQKSALKENKNIDTGQTEIHGTLEEGLSRTRLADANRSLEEIEQIIIKKQEKVDFIKNKFEISDDYMKSFEKEIAEIIDNITKAVKQISVGNQDLALN